MDLSTIKPATARIDILHPNSGRPTGLSIEVTSLHSDAVRRVQRDHMDEALKRRGKARTAEQIEQNSREVLAAAIVGFDFKGDASWGGEKLAPTPENKALLLAEGWLRGQVEEAVNDEATFFRN